VRHEGADWGTRYAHHSSIFCRLFGVLTVLVFFFFCNAIDGDLGSSESILG
jgi:hypothetical protein